MSLESIRFDKVQGSLQILNQLLLPEHTVYEPVNDVEDAWKAIREMKTRGAPAIAIVGALSIAVELRHKANTGEFKSIQDVATFINDSFSYLKTARPTAVNISEAATRFMKHISELSQNELDTKKFTDTLYNQLSQMLVVTGLTLHSMM